jgi:cell wall-associated NlpC family hydrolase
MQSVQGMGSFSSASGPTNGREACAWAVNRVLSNAGIRPLGDNPNYVPSVESALQNGRGQQVSAAQAQAGDIVIAKDQRHIGICMNNGCSQVRSNSSSAATFSWNSNGNFDGAYDRYGGANHIYRVTQP